MAFHYQNIIKEKDFKYEGINEKYINVDTKVKELINIIKIQIQEKQKKEIELISKLDTLSPLKTLTRGYCITEKDGKIVKYAKDLKPKDEIKLKLVDGEKQAIII